MNKFLNSNYSKIIYNNIDDIDAISIALTITICFALTITICYGFFSFILQVILIII